jgi:hypothetical protein
MLTTAVPVNPSAETTPWADTDTTAVFEDCHRPPDPANNDVMSIVASGVD